MRTTGVSKIKKGGKARFHLESYSVDTSTKQTPGQTAPAGLPLCRQKTARFCAS